MKNNWPVFCVTKFSILHLESVEKNVHFRFEIRSGKNVERVCFFPCVFAAACVDRSM